MQKQIALVDTVSKTEIVSILFFKNQKVEKSVN